MSIYVTLVDKKLITAKINNNKLRRVGIRRMNLLHRQFIIIILLLSNVLFATTNLEKVSLRLHWKNQFEFAGFYAAKEQGYYQQAGLDVEILEYQNEIDIFDEVVSEKVDFAVWGSSVIEKWMNGADVVLLANYFKRSPLVLATQPEIRLPSDLNNKSLMISKADTRSANFVQMYRTFNIDSNTLKIVPPTFNMQAFKEKKVDAVAIYLTNEPYLLQKEKIAYNIIDPNNYGVALYDLNLFTSKNMADKNPDIAHSFTQATNKGWSYALEHPQEIVDLILKKYNTQNKSREHLLYEAQETQKMILAKTYPIGSINPKNIEKIGALFTELGMSEPVESYDGLLFKSIEDKIAPLLNLTQKEISFIKSHPKILVGNDKAWPPFDFYEDGEAKGYIIDFLKEVEVMTGLHFEFVQDDNWDNLVKKIETRELDVLSALEPTEQRKKLIDFTPPVITTFKSIIVKKNASDMHSYKDLYGKTVAVIKGYAFEEEIANNYPQIKMALVENPLEGLKMVSSGRADAFLENQVVASYLINKYLISNVKITGSPKFPNLNEDDEILLASRNDWPELESILSKIITKLPEESVRKLEARWLNNISSSTKVSLELTEEEKSYLKQKDSIKVCADPNWMPFESIVNGKHTGMSADYMQLLSKKLHIPFNLVPTLSWNDALQKAKARECDIFPLAMQTPERKTYMNFTKPYLEVPLVVATTYDKPFIPELSTIIDKKLGAVKGYAFTELLRDEYPNIEIIEYETLYDALESTYSGKIYGVIDNLSTLAYTIHRSFPETLKISGRMEKDWVLGIAARNDEALLVSVLDKALTTIDDTTKREIHSKWVSVRFEQGTDYTLLWKVAGLFAFVLFISYLWYRRLKRINIALNEAYNELGDQKKTFEILFEESSDGLLLLQNNRFVACNQKIVDIYGRSSKQELLSLHPSQLSPKYQPDGQVSMKKADEMIKVAFEKGFNEFEWLHRRSNGNDFWCKIALNKIMVDSIESIYARVRDIDEEKKTQQALVQEREKLDSLINDMGERFVVFSHDIKGDLLYVSDGFTSVFGISDSENHQLNFKSSIKWSEDSIQLWVNNTSYLLKNKDKNRQIEMSFIHPNGKECFISVTSHIGYDKKNNIETIDGIIENVTEQKLIERFIKEQAITDQLTGLYNRHKIDESITYQIEKSNRYGTSFCIAILDIDYFKRVNDTYGHLNGDKVLISIANILKEHKRSTDTIGRWGGEEFIVIAPHINEKGMTSLAQKMRKEIEMHTFNDMTSITASFGVTSNIEGDTAHTLLARADSALYEAKAKGRNQVVCK